MYAGFEHGPMCEVERGDGNHFRGGDALVGGFAALLGEAAAAANSSGRLDGQGKDWRVR
jgi:hypothetical protein